MVRYFIFLLLFIPQLLLAEPQQKLSLELQDASLPQTIRLFAKYLKLNVLISPEISGTTTLHLQAVYPQYALDALLAANNLNKWQEGNILYIASNEELIKRKQTFIKWQEVNEVSMPLVTKIWHIHYAKAEDIARLIQDGQVSLLSRRGTVRVDTRTNIICVQDIAEKLAHISLLIKQMDIPVQQIVIEARLASVDHSFERELGISFTNQPVNAENSKNLISTPGAYSLAVARLADGSLLDVKLSALENAGHADVISNPSLFTANQQPASIEAGEEVPYQEVSEGGGTAVVFKKAVLGLKVTPQVLPGNQVLLQLQINQDRPSSKMVLGMPTISTRQIITNVLVKNGQTIVLGGIYEANRENNQQRIPFISQLPLMGALLRQYSTQLSKRELLIFVTPKIITQT